MQEHQVHTVSGPLSRVVTHAVGYQYHGVAPGIHIGMPSGSLTLVVPLDGPLVVSTPGRTDATPYNGILAGLHTGPVHIHHCDSGRGLQLALSPSGARALFGLPASELANRSVELDAVLGSVTEWMLDELSGAPSWQAQFATLERVLLRAARRMEARSAAPEVRESWRLIRGTDGRIPVTTLADRVGWSTRRLQVRFRAEYGVTPKSACRIARFELSTLLLRGAHPRLADVAAECGYADQAHLAREWRDLAGVAPSRWRVEDNLAFVQDDASPMRHD